jgi:retinol dehydrogenase 12
MGTKMGQALHFFHSQLFADLPYPTTKFTGQTIIVTGSNVGMGLEAARHFVRLDAAKVILAVRTLSKGQAAAASITESTHRNGVVEVWELDLAKYASVKAFAERANAELSRIDVLVANAGMYTFDFTMAEDNEKTITVNVVSTLLLGLLLLPKLRETSTQYKKSSVLTFTGSFVHYMTNFPERKNANVFVGLAKSEKANMRDR